MSSNDWWKPENLKKKEQSFLRQNKLDQIDVSNDFGSYRVMRATGDLSKSSIAKHNDIFPAFRVKAIKKILGKFDPKRIYDVGCGLGYTTNEICKEYPKATVIGLDVSEDAIEFARQNFCGCDFFSEPVDPKNKKQSFPADLIFAFEFYPFTRTSSLSDHIAYIDHLTNKMYKHGKLVIFQVWDNPESLSANYKELISNFSNLKFELHTMPIKQIGKYFGLNLFSNLLSQITRLVFRYLINRPLGKTKLLIISRENLSG